MRRHRGYSSGYAAHDNQGTIDVGETHVVIHANGTSKPLVVKILGKEYNAKGRLTGIVLDSLAHARATHRLSDFHVSGVIVTELTVIGGGDEDEETGDEEMDEREPAQPATAADEPATVWDDALTAWEDGLVAPY